MGGAGDSPAPVGDPPTGTALSHVAKRPFSLPRIVVSVASGGSPDGTGGSPVLPGNHFPNRFLAFDVRHRLVARHSEFAGTIKQKGRKHKLSRPSRRQIQIYREKLATKALRWPVASQ